MANCEFNLNYTLDSGGDGLVVSGSFQAASCDVSSAFTALKSVLGNPSAGYDGSQCDFVFFNTDSGELPGVFSYHSDNSCSQADMVSALEVAYPGIGVDQSSGGSGVSSLLFFGAVLIVMFALGVSQGFRLNPGGR